MTFGPACERCGANSYEGSEPEPVVCPFCRKPKRRGSRQELVKVLRRAQTTLAMCAGYLAGGSVASKESVQAEIRKSFKEIEDI